MGKGFNYKEIAYAALLLAFAFFITCSNSTEPDLKSSLHLSVSSWNAPDSGGVSVPVRILSDDDTTVYNWKINSDSTWLTLSADSGITPGEFTITADSNVTGLDRAAKMQIVVDDADSSSEEFTVNQNSKHGLIQVGHYKPPYCSEALFVEGEYAYMGGCLGGLIAVDISDSSHPYDYSWHTSEARELCIFKSGDYVYVIGLHTENSEVTGMTEIYDMSDPLYPRPRSRINTEYSLGGAVYGDYLFIADYNALQIYDISDPAHPDSIASVSTAGGTISAAVYQNYVIYSEEDQGIHIADISDPSNPAEVGSYKVHGFVSDIFISGNYVFLACYKNGVKMLDISNPASPGLMREFIDDGQPYRLFADDKYVYVAAFGNFVNMFDITDPACTKLVARWKTPTQIYGISASDDYVYVVDRDYGLYTLRLIP